jgi:hypothetical protein
MPDSPADLLETATPSGVALTDAPPGGGARGGASGDPVQHREWLRTLAAELEMLRNAHEALEHLLRVGVATLGAAGGWVGLSMQDSDALVVIGTHGGVPFTAGERLPRDRAFGARAVRSNATIFADPATGVRWPDAQVDRKPVRAVAAPMPGDSGDPLGVLCMIGGSARIFTVQDGALAAELGALAALVLRRTDPARPTEAEFTPPPPLSGDIEGLLLDAVRATSVADFAALAAARLDHPRLLGLAISTYDHPNAALHFVTAVGALTSLRNVHTPLAHERASTLLRQQSAVTMPDARQIVPPEWRALVPTLPGAALALHHGSGLTGRVDVVFDPEREIPHEAIARLERAGATLARSIAALTMRQGQAPVTADSATVDGMRNAITTRLHEITSPIAGVAALAELLLADESLQGETRDTIDLIRTSAGRASDAARSLRDLGRGSGARDTPTSFPQVLAAALRETDDALRALSIEVTTELDANLPPLPLSAALVLEWLVDALRAGERALLSLQRRWIRIAAAMDGPHVTLLVMHPAPGNTMLPAGRSIGPARATVTRTDDGLLRRQLLIPLQIGSNLST